MILMISTQSRFSVLLVTLIVLGCGRNVDSTPSDIKSTQKQQSLATISANPNPIPAGEGLGSTQITWDTGDRSFGQIFISLDGGPDRKMLAQGAKGVKDVDWIKNGHTYEFRLYTGKEHSQLIASVEVRRAK